MTPGMSSGARSLAPPGPLQCLQPRPGGSMARRVLVLLALSLSPLVAHADEAVLPDGSHIPGELSLTKTGRLAFMPNKRGAGPARAVEYRLAGTPAPFRAGPGMLLRLAGGQEVSGVFLGTDGDKLLLRTAW